MYADGGRYPFGDKVHMRVSVGNAYEKMVAGFEGCVVLFSTHDPACSRYQLFAEVKNMNFRLWLCRKIVPTGYAVVPHEPTKAMLKAACASMSPSKRPTPDWVPVKQKHQIRYRAMIDASALPE